MTAKIAAEIAKLSDSTRKFCFVIDDPPIERARSKNVELLSWTFNHVTGRSMRGFSLLQAGWCDPFSYIPFALELVASAKEALRICGIDLSVDMRSCGGKRRKNAMRSKLDLAIDMLKSGLAAGLPADYVLVDSWFTSCRFIRRVKDLGLDVIGMLRKSKQHYLWNGKKYNLSRLFKAIPACMKNRRGDDIICIVNVMTTGNDPIPMRIVFVRNRSNRRDWLAVASTDIDISAEEIISLYARRWFIETNFRAQKQYFGLGTESFARSFDTQIAFATAASVRYMMPELSRRCNCDKRGMGDFYRDICCQIDEIPFHDALDSLMNCFRNLAKELEEAGHLKPGHFKEVQEFIEEKLSGWFSRLSQYLQSVLSPEGGENSIQVFKELPA